MVFRVISYKVIYFFENINELESIIRTTSATQRAANEVYHKFIDLCNNNEISLKLQKMGKRCSKNN